MSGMDWTPVGTALLGSWPQHVAGWGKSGIAAYLSELQARGVTPDAALVAIRSCPAGQEFPPSAPKLAALARKDPSRPTPDEALAQIYGPGGVFGFKRKGVTVSPWVLAFVERYGRERLWLLEVGDDQYGELRRKEVRLAFEQFLEATDGRELASIARGRGSLHEFDPLAGLGLQPPVSRGLEAGERA